MKTKAARISIHLIACIAFLSVPVLTSPDVYRLRDLIAIAPFRSDFLFYLLLVGFFYLNSFVLIPRFYFTKKYFLFVLFLFLLFCIILLAPILLIDHPTMQVPHRIENHPGMHRMAPVIFVRDIFYRGFIFLVVTFFSLVIRISGQWRQAQQEKIDSQLSYLKAQINPHFLFNTLNSIYSLAITKSDETPKAIVKLSGMMRYVTSECNTDFVPLEKEISYISDYIDLQKIRLRNTVELEYSVSGEAGDKTIVPLLLIPFVENAFKHGVNPEENSRITIRIAIGANDIHMEVKNNKVNERITDKTGIGIETTEHRLKLSYPGRHGLKIVNNETYYSVTLNIRLK